MKGDVGPSILHQPVELVQLSGDLLNLVQDDLLFGMCSLLFGLDTQKFEASRISDQDVVLKQSIQRLSG